MNIKEYSFTLHNYYSSLLKCYINQYIQIIEDYQLHYHNILLAGGIPQKIPLIKEYLREILKTNVIQSANTIDETFEGLKKITKLIKK